MRRIRKNGKKGQNLVEYAIVVSIVTIAMVAMSTYVFRAVEATKRAIEEEFQK